MVKVLVEAAALNQEDLKIGLRASRFIHGDWKLPEDSRRSGIVKKDDGSQFLVEQNVESVLRIFPHSPEQARNILEILEYKVFADNPLALKDSWEVPDIRLTHQLLPLVSPEEFQKVQASIFVYQSAQLIVLKRKTSIPGADFAIPTGINQSLVEFISSVNTNE